VDLLGRGRWRQRDVHFVFLGGVLGVCIGVRLPHFPPVNPRASGSKYILRFGLFAFRPTRYTIRTSVDGGRGCPKCEFLLGLL